MALRKNGGAWFALSSGQQLHIGVTPEFAPRQKGHVALRCTDLGAVKAAFEAAAVAYSADEEAGVPRVFLRDPWGNRLEIVQGDTKACCADD